MVLFAFYRGFLERLFEVLRDTFDIDTQVLATLIAPPCDQTKPTFAHLKLRQYIVLKPQPYLPSPLGKPPDLGIGGSHRDKAKRSAFCA